jgi:hypothetical protein
MPEKSIVPPGVDIWKFDPTGYPDVVSIVTVPVTDQDGWLVKVKSVSVKVTGSASTGSGITKNKAERNNDCRRTNVLQKVALPMSYCPHSFVTWIYPIWEIFVATRRPKWNVSSADD